MVVFLVGFMGSGKSTLGKKVASSLGFDFIDMDNDIISKERMTINEIFSKMGEAYFRKTENEIIRGYEDLENTIIATGGGAPCHNGNMDLMNMYGITIYLKLSPKAIFDRVKNARNKRPLLKDKSDEEILTFIENKLQEREEFYSKSKYIVDAINPQVSDITSLLFETC